MMTGSNRPRLAAHTLELSLVTLARSNGDGLGVGGLQQPVDPAAPV